MRSECWVAVKVVNCHYSVQLPPLTMGSILPDCIISGSTTNTLKVMGMYLLFYSSTEEQRSSVSILEVQCS